MNILPVGEVEEKLVADGYRLKVMADGQHIFPRFSDDGTPRREVYRAYLKGEGQDRVGVWILAGEHTQEELDAIPVRNSDGTVRGLTFGEYRRSNS